MGHQAASQRVKRRPATGASGPGALALAPWAWSFQSQMKVITNAELTGSGNAYRDVASALGRDGVVCFPEGPSYRLAASLYSPAAILRLQQSKRRSGHHPALVFVADAGMLPSVAANIPAAARRLAGALWPGPLTLLLEPSPNLPPQVLKTLTRATGKIGVRCPAHAIAARILREFGGPVFVSSANMERKAGAHSVAQVHKNFRQRVDVCVDIGDLPPFPPSTLVDFSDGEWTIAREGGVPAATIQATLA